jgi:hypothetical protein
MADRSDVMPAATLDQARAAKQRALEVFRPLADVVGVGITRAAEGYALKVNLRQQPRGGISLPKNVDGIPVMIEVVGPIVKA